MAAVSISLMAAGSASAFTVKSAKLISYKGELVYVFAICAPSGGQFDIAATFTPKPKKKGLKTLHPGATQTQSKGCYPARVSAKIVKKQGSCTGLECGAVKGHVYRARVTVTDKKTGKKKHPKTKQRRA